MSRSSLPWQSVRIPSCYSPLKIRFTRQSIDLEVQAHVRLMGSWLNATVMGSSPLLPTSELVTDPSSNTDSALVFMAGYGKWLSRTTIPRMSVSVEFAAMK
jgi:hypothetical protein